MIFVLLRNEWITTSLKYLEAGFNNNYFGLDPNFFVQSKDQQEMEEVLFYKSTTIPILIK